jgi:hypothetical protein
VAEASSSRCVPATSLGSFDVRPPHICADLTTPMHADFAHALRSCRIARLVGRVNGGACAIACDAGGAIDAAGLPWTIVRRRAGNHRWRAGPLWVVRSTCWSAPAAAEDGAPEVSARRP